MGGFGGAFVAGAGADDRDLVRVVRGGDAGDGVGAGDLRGIQVVDFRFAGGLVFGGGAGAGSVFVEPGRFGCWGGDGGGGFVGDFGGVVDRGAGVGGCGGDAGDGGGGGDRVADFVCGVRDLYLHGERGVGGVCLAVVRLPEIGGVAGEGGRGRGGFERVVFYGASCGGAAGTAGLVADDFGFGGGFYRRVFVVGALFAIPVDLAGVCESCDRGCGGFRVGGVDFVWGVSGCAGLRFWRGGEGRWILARQAASVFFVWGCGFGVGARGGLAFGGVGG